MGISIREAKGDMGYGRFIRSGSNCNQGQIEVGDGKRSKDKGCTKRCSKD